MKQLKFLYIGFNRFAIAFYLLLVMLNILYAVPSAPGIKKYKNQSQQPGDLKEVTLKILNCTGRRMWIDDLLGIASEDAITRDVRAYDLVEITHLYLSKDLEKSGTVDRFSKNTIKYSFSDLLYRDENGEQKDRKKSGQFVFGKSDFAFDWYENIDQVDLTFSGTTATVLLKPGKNEEASAVFISNAPCADMRERSCSQTAFSSVPDQLGGYPYITINPQLQSKVIDDPVIDACKPYQREQAYKYYDVGLQDNLTSSMVTPGDVIQFKFPFAPEDRSAVVCKYIWRIKNAGEKIDCQDTKGNTRDDIAMQFTQDGTRIRVMCVGKNCPKLKNT
ncbi:hypothetical protein [Facilibium subflavum]|uniref:hypothetical protein n=1 Tax=Facilibium subflavum TaxID=2219058 RepID=UPI000E646D80|nr:hypothetical protein [Facilibium subflavum]